MKKFFAVFSCVAIFAIGLISCTPQTIPDTGSQNLNPVMQGPKPDEIQPEMPNPEGPRPDEPQPGEPQPGEPHPGEPQPEMPQPGEPQPEAPGDPQILSFTSAGNTLNPGQCTTLEWNVQGGFGVTLIDQTVDRIGQLQVCPAVSTTYFLRVDTGKEILQREILITVTGSGQTQGEIQQPTSSGPLPGGCAGAPVIPFFNANPVSISSGQSSTLNWGNITNGTSGPLVKSAKIEPGLGEVGSGANSRKVNPSKTTTYILTASGCGGTSTRQVTVTVNSSGSSSTKPTKSGGNNNPPFIISPIPAIQIQPSFDLSLENIYLRSDKHVIATIKNVSSSNMKGSVTLNCTASGSYNDPSTGKKTNVEEKSSVSADLTLSSGSRSELDTKFVQSSATNDMYVKCSITPPSGDTNSSNNSRGPVKIK